MSGKVKEVFPGSNSSLGFYSFYDYIIPPDATRIMVIKGGPGVGKSSFMKLIAKEMEERGFDLEIHHCSSDNNSLDGVVFPEIKVALIDGTSPHIVDPRNPGAVDEIIHLGDYWNEVGLRKQRQEILEVNREVGRLFQRGYRYLRAAKMIHDDLEAIYQDGMDFGAANQRAWECKNNIFKQLTPNGTPGKLRKLFASAITPEGFRNFLPSIIGGVGKVIGVTGEPGTGKATLINKIAEAALELGYDCEAYYCAFDPLKMEHLVIPELELALTTDIEPHRTDAAIIGEVINMDGCLDSTLITKYGRAMEESRALREQLLEKAVYFINRAKASHDQMEQYYIPNMNFAAITELRQKTLERILGFAAEFAPVH